jgi:hypothetical protein
MTVPAGDHKTIRDRLWAWPTFEVSQATALSDV